MNEQVLLELIKKWEWIPISEVTCDDSDALDIETRIINAKIKGERDGRMKCSASLMALIDILGDNK